MVCVTMFSLKQAVHVLLTEIEDDCLHEPTITCLTHLVQALSQQLLELNFGARQGCQGHQIN